MFFGLPTPPSRPKSMTPQELPRHADTVVIGGGTAGAAIAGLLAERGDQSVLLLEAGPDYGHLSQGRWPPELVDGRVVADTHNWSYNSAASNGQLDHPLQRARVIGGCSSHNGCIALWGSRADCDAWAAAGNTGWATEDLLPHFRRASDRLRVRNFAPEEITPFHAACLDAMVETGLPPTADLNDIDENVAAAISPVNILHGTRWNTSFAYLDPVRGSECLAVIGDALVNKISLDGSRAASVEVVLSGKLATVEAGRVVLCAGVYGSPAILLRSGVGPSEELTRLGVSTRLHLSGVGSNLHDHPSFNLNFRSTRLFDSLMDAFTAKGKTVFSEQSLAKARSSHCTEAFDLHIAPVASPDPREDGHWEFKMCVANMAPLSRGRLTLRDPDPRTAPLIDTGYLTDPDDIDIAVLLDGIDVTRDIVSRPHLAELIGDELEETARVTSAPCVRREALHYYHPVGTCKMGPGSDPCAVVDPTGKVHGIDGVYVADASVMPVVPRANTNLPTLMLAEKIAASIY